MSGLSLCLHLRVPVCFLSTLVRQEQFEFVNGVVGNSIPPEYINACRKGFEDAMAKGPLIGHPVQGVRVTITDGQSHAVDSSEMAFRIAAAAAFRTGAHGAGPGILEPVMKVEVSAPPEFQGVCVSLRNKRKGQLQVRCRSRSTLAWQPLGTTRKQSPPS